jgi:hypothetical protein
VRKLAGIPVMAAFIAVLLAGSAVAATMSFNAVYEPLSQNPPKQKFTASWSGIGQDGLAFINYGDGAYSPFWSGGSGNKTVYHTYATTPMRVSQRISLGIHISAPTRVSCGTPSPRVRRTPTGDAHPRHAGTILGVSCSPDAL